MPGWLLAVQVYNDQWKLQKLFTSCCCKVYLYLNQSHKLKKFSRSLISTNTQIYLDCRTQLTCARISISIVNTVTDFAVCQFTQLERRLWFQKITLWNLVSKVYGFRDASTLLSCKRKATIVLFDMKICAI